MRPWMAVSEIAPRKGMVLQWGHGLAAVDGGHGRDKHARANQLQWGHGLAAVDGGFMWLVGVHLLSLQWGHGLAAVDGVAEGLAHVEVDQLQWGHGLAAVDGGNTRRASVPAAKASMGPRPCGRGWSYGLPGSATDD